ncbi:pro-resilin-like [Panulirus ornatus]|uniref:pro-resilin-like n=1 Tax=Panulirus ornatus TaxID=150431 RepID=UPI003A8BCED0
MAAFVVSIVARPSDKPGNDASQVPANYEFQYAVKDGDSGNDFTHLEDRDGDAVSGSYYVQLPDGRLQKVIYTVSGDSGYVAEIAYEGEAQYPPSEPPAYP